MEKTTQPLQIEQIFSTAANGNKSLQRMIVWDNDLAYDVMWSGKKVPLVRMMRRAPDGVFYEVAAKEEGKPCTYKYHLFSQHDTIYENKNTAGNHESLVALAYGSTGTVRGGLVLLRENRGFNVFYSEDQWASFELTPNGVRYVREVEGELHPKLTKIQQGVKPTPAVVIDGKTVLPIDRKVQLPQTVYRQHGRV